jgi:hypothetical protein
MNDNGVVQRWQHEALEAKCEALQRENQILALEIANMKKYSCVVTNITKVPDDDLAGDGEGNDCILDAGKCNNCEDIGGNYPYCKMIGGGEG